MESSLRSSAVKYLGWLYLTYLGLLPVITTFVLLARYSGDMAIFWYFLGGTVAVSVYLAYIGSYVPIPRSLLRLALVALDGPFFALLALWGRVDVTSLVINGYLVDGTAVWLAIAILALQSPLPTRGQRIASVLFMVVALFVTSWMAWPYLVNELWGSWASLGWLVLGVAEATWVRYRVLGADDVLRDPQHSAGYILVFLLMWLAALFSAPLLGQTTWIQSWIGS